MVTWLEITLLFCLCPCHVFQLLIKPESDIDFPLLALAHRFTLLSKFRIKVPPVNGLSD